jgi:endonuclease YncB( thermonuclease family)
MDLISLVLYVSLSVSIEATVIRVYDGDTIFVNLNTEGPSILTDNLSIRIAGIDTPELRGNCRQEKALAQKAKALVEEALPKGSTIYLSRYTRGKYFRLVADVSTGDKDIATMLLQEGLAVRYYGKTKTKDWCS